MLTDEELKYYILLQKLFRERGCNNGNTEFQWDKEGNEILCPLPIDRDNPERGLLGMLKGVFQLSNIKSRQSWQVRMNTYGKESYEGRTPTLALLKALAAQVQDGER